MYVCIYIYMYIYIHTYVNVCVCVCVYIGHVQGGVRAGCGAGGDGADIHEDGGDGRLWHPQAPLKVRSQSMHIRVCLRC